MMLITNQYSYSKYLYTPPINAVKVKRQKSCALESLASFLQQKNKKESLASACLIQLTD